MMAGFGLIWILVLGAVGYAVYVAVTRSGGGGRRSASTANHAEEILRQRFARGDIDREEYESRLRELQR